MHWSLILDPAQLVPSLIVAVVALLLLAIPFGLGRGTGGLAVLATLAVTWLYPDGSRGLVTDALRPMRQLMSTAEDRKDARNDAIDRAVGDPRAGGGR